MKKKIAIKLLAFALGLVCVGGFVGCSGCDEEEQSSHEYIQPEAPDGLALSQTSVQALLGDSIQLNATYGAIEDATLSFSSDNEAVATVSSSGYVTAVGLGTANVSAHYGEQTVSCNVTVTLGNLLPNIAFENALGDEMNVTTADTLNFAAKVEFNGKKYDNCTINYTLSDDTVGKVENGVFTPLKKGVTTVTATASWANVTSLTLTKSFTVNVISDVEISINGGKNNDIYLYTTESHAGKTFATESAFDVSIKVDGVAVTPTIELVDGENTVITMNAEKNKINSVSYGKAKIAVSYPFEGQTFTKEVSVYVERPLVEWGETMKYFSALDGDGKGNFTIADMFGADEIVDAYADDEPLTVENGKAYGLETNRDGVTPTTLTLYTSTVGYEVNVEAYTKVITKASDLSVFVLDYDITQNSKYLDGYVVLANDIDYTKDSNYTVNVDAGYSYKNTATNTTNYRGFAGVFDGQGHSMKVQVANYGVFVYATKGTTIKNVAIEAESAADDSVVFWRAENSTNVEPSCIENVYVKISDYAEKITSATKSIRPTTLFNSQWAYTSMRQVIVEVDAPFAYDVAQAQAGAEIYDGKAFYNYGVIAKTTGYVADERAKDANGAYYKNESNEWVYNLYKKDGDSWTLDMENGTNKKNTYTDYYAKSGYGYQDVYVLTGTSPVNGKEVDNVMPLIGFASNQTVPSYAVYALNDAPNGEALSTTLYEGQKVYTNTTDSIKRYGTYAAMKAATGNSYANFDSTCWDVSTFGFPVFRSVVDKMSQTTFDGEATADDVYVSLGAEAKALDITAYGGFGVQPTFTVESNGEYINLTQSGNEWLLEAEAFMPDETYATVKASYTVGGVEYTRTLHVYVLLPITEYSQTMTYFSALDGDGKGGITLADVVGTGATITSARDEQNKKLDVKDNKVYGVATDRNGMKATTITVFTETQGYLIQIEAYTKVITTATEMKTFNTTEFTADLDGYFVLGNDIDYTTETDTYAYNTHSTRTYRFAGVFDGLGHSMKVQIGEYGIFGLATDNTVVKNVAIETNSPGNRSVVFWYGTNCGSTTPSRIENVYVKISDYAEKITNAASNARPTALFTSQWAYTSMRQVIVEVDAPNAYTLEQAQSGSAINGEKTFYNYGIIALTTSYAADYAVNKVVQKYSYENGEYKLNNESGTYTQGKYTDFFKHATYGYQDVYVVTGTSTVGGVEVDNEMPLISFANNTTAPTYAIYAFNDAEEVITSIYHDTPTPLVFTNTTNSIKRYGTYQTMKEDTDNDYSNFNSYWDTTNGYPVFKSATA